MDSRDHRTEELIDEALAEEIALLGELMATAAAAARPLTQSEVDEALGLCEGADDVRGRLGEHAVIERATGYIAQTRGLDMARAARVLRAAAAEAGITDADAARAVLKGPSPAS